MQKHSLTKTNRILLSLLVLFWLSIALLGFYGHPTGDDYYYALATRSAMETGGIFAALKAAFLGTATQYRIWQGTYSAMFFMHLAPQIFGDWAYRLFPACHTAFFLGGLLSLCLAGGDHLGLKRSHTLNLFAILGILMLEGVPNPGESYYWYNGSMYYTGYFALSMFFGAALLRLRPDSPRRKAPLLFLLALIIGGGNYVSLLPLILLVFFYQVILCFRKEFSLLRMVALPWTGLILGLIISALAPGNAVRAASSHASAPLWAITRSLKQGVFYIGWWTGIPWLLAMIGLTLLFLQALPEAKLSFRHPWLVIPVLYGIFASMSTPTFYAQSSTGPARAFDLSYYGFCLLMPAILFYFLGAVRKLVREKFLQKREPGSSSCRLLSKVPLLAAALTILATLGLGRLEVPFSATLHLPVPVRAAGLLLTGEARDYAAQEAARMDYLTDPSVTDAVLTPFTVSDQMTNMLYVGDFDSDPENPTNQTVAAYFGKNTLRVDYSQENISAKNF